MRDRGISNPGLKSVVTVGAAAGGALMILWGQPIRVLGIVVMATASLMILNYLYAWALMRRMRQGNHSVGRWTVAPATFDRFRSAERARKKRKNNWRMPRRDWPAGLPVIFSDNAVVVGNTYFRLGSAGMSRFTFVRIEHDSVPSVEFSVTLTVYGAGTQSRTARYRGHLRIPIADGAGIEAARVVSHFQKFVAL